MHAVDPRLAAEVAFGPRRGVRPSLSEVLARLARLTPEGAAQHEGERLGCHRQKQREQNFEVGVASPAAFDPADEFERVARVASGHERHLVAIGNLADGGVLTD
jgi:hypothetical protein